MINTLKNNSSSISNLLVLIFWIFLIFLFLNELFGDKNYPEKDSFENTRKNSKIIVYNFNTNWCGYSKRFQPIWDRFSESVTNTDIETVDVKCDDNQNADLVKKYNIEGFPTVVIEDRDTVTKYNGERSVNGLRKALHLLPIIDDVQEDMMPSTVGCGNVQKQNEKIIIYNFNTTWCGHSKNFQPIWDKFVKSLPADGNIIAIDAKCDDDENADLVALYEVTGFPTIVKVDGDQFAKYVGERSVNAIRNALGLHSISENVEKVVRFKEDKTIIYNFNTSWCGYSVRFQPIWDEFSKLVDNTNVIAIDVKCDNDENKKLCSQFDIPGYPSIVKVTSDGTDNYNGPRTVESLLEFVDL